MKYFEILWLICSFVNNVHATCEFVYFAVIWCVLQNVYCTTLTEMIKIRHNGKKFLDHG